MTAPILADDLGPRGRRIVLVATVLSGVALLGVLWLALGRLASRGQLEWSRWEEFTDPAILRFLGGGLANTLKAAALGMVLSTSIGGLLALARLSRSRPIRAAAGTYVELFRALPLLLLILFSAIVLPRYGIDFGPFGFLVVGLTLYNSAVLGELFRAGIRSLDRGQSEAAFAIGLTYWQAMFLVVLPQAVRRMVPATVSQLVVLLKDTSLGFVIAYEELLRRGRILGQPAPPTFASNLLQSTVAVALIYVVISYTLSRVARRLEDRQRRRYNASAITVSGVEDLT